MSKKQTTCNDICFALSDEIRLNILFSLEEGEKDVSTLVSLLGKNQSLVSHHLKILRDANLVVNRYRGKSIVYSLADPSVKEFLDSLRKLTDYINQIGLCIERGKKGVIISDKRSLSPQECANMGKESLGK
ncbi:MAG: ArsR/SmtB family transcription factor [Thermoprotei archaeon]|jgi:DNA-binding transcriptional ArsR family regulator